MFKQAKYSSFRIGLWLFCVALFLFQYGVRTAIPSVLNEDLRNYFSTDAAGVGNLVSVFFLSSSILQIPAGYIVDKFKEKIILIISFLCISIGILIFICTNHCVVASIGQFVLSIGCSFAFLLVIKVTNDTFSRDKIALMTSCVISCGGLGPIAISSLLAYLSKTYHWKMVLIGFATIAFIAALIALFILTECDIQNKSKNQLTLPNSSITESIKIVFSDRMYSLITIFGMMILGAIVAFSDFCGLSFISYLYEVDKLQASYANNMIYVGTMCGGPALAYIAEKIKSYTKVMFASALMMMFLFGIVIFLKVHFFILHIVLFLLGLVAASEILIFPAILSLVPKHIAASTVGIINCVLMLGAMTIINLVGRFMNFSEAHVIVYQNGMIPLIIAPFIAIVVICFVNHNYDGK